MPDFAQTITTAYAGEQLAMAERMDSAAIAARARHDAGLISLAAGRHLEAAQLLEQLRVDQANERITISCQVSDIELVWQLAEAGTGTASHVTVSLPEREARRLDGQHPLIEESLHRLAALAETAA